MYGKVCVIYITCIILLYLVSVTKKNILCPLVSSITFLADIICISFYLPFLKKDEIFYFIFIIELIPYLMSIRADYFNLCIYNLYFLLLLIDISNINTQSISIFCVISNLLVILMVMIQCYYYNLRRIKNAIIVALFIGQILIFLFIYKLGECIFIIIFHIFHLIFLL